MKIQTTSKRNPDEFKFRVEFRFVNASGAILNAKIWEISNGPTDPPRFYCLQGQAMLADHQPVLQKIGPANYLITIKLAAGGAEWTTTVLERFDYAVICRQWSASPLTLALIIDRRERRFEIHTALGIF